MESDSEDLILLNPSNVRRLHPDYPMDAMAGRFKQNVQKQVRNLKESTDQLVGAFLRFEASRTEGDLQIVVNARTKVQEIRTHLVRMRGEATMEDDKESDVAIKSANEELARVGRSLETAALSTDRSLSLTSTAPTNLVGDSFWEPVCNFPPTNSDQVARTTSDHDSIIIDTVPNLLNTLQVEAEVNDVRLNHSVDPPPGFARLGPPPSIRPRSRPASSVASSRTKDLRAAQNEAERKACISQSRLDEEKLELNEQEAAEAARLKMAADDAIVAEKAKSNRSRVRRELERKRFEVDAALSETIAQIEDDNNNDLRSSHGLDAESISDWVSTTHSQNLEVSNASILAHLSDCNFLRS
jgi:hypothetical protein